YVLFVDPETASDPSLPASFERVVVPTRHPPAEAASSSGRRDLTDLWRMGWAVARHRPDVFFFPSVYTFFPLLRPVRSIVAIHDVIAERHPRQVFARRRLQLFWKAKLAIAVRQAHLILTVSDHARAGIIEQFGVPPARLRVILEAPDAIFRRLPAARDPTELLPACALPSGARYLLYVGGISPHKNLHVLLRSYRALIADGEFEGLRLLLVGDHSGDVFYSAYEGLRAEVARHGLDGVCFTGFVPDDMLVDLYNRAELLILPSLEEGFGLPAIEAAACGTPVVASDVGPVGSLLGPAAWTFPPSDAAALTDGLRSLLRDPARRRAMGDAGLRRAATFTWERAAAEAHALFHELGGR
ncbi:MAG TPA: glycosyltransferase family 1 protein, partial [Candidatus Limnocylindrales bacterium]|nr:glycosyltransferase family 1 protein [Candidatus Limnocylindrales bacterium]